MIDFGISHNYRNSDGSHIPFKFNEHFSGNFLFASFNGCINKLLSRRDDITSIIILMVYLLNDKKLPWSGFKEKFEGRHFTFGDYLKERSGPSYMTGLIDMAPRSMFKLLKKCFTAEYEVEPPYEELIQMIKEQLVQEIRIGADLQPILHEYEWQNHQPEPRASRR